jgi:hypothetical protein
MRILACVTLIIVIAGCTRLKPTDLLQNGVLVERTSEKAPQLAAECISRNASRRPYYGVPLVQIKPADPPAVVEVWIYSIFTDSVNLSGIAAIQPRDQGSLISLRSDPEFAVSPDRDAPRRWLEGC